MLRLDPAPDRRLQAILARFFQQRGKIFTKKEKEAKRKKGEACGNCRSRGNRSRMPSAIFS
jgi:hypothetical protein